MADLKMPEINYVVISGNLTRDPIFRTTSNRTPVVNFSIASNRKFKDSNDNWQEDVCYVSIVAWNKLAESCKERLHKGSAVLIDGELQSRSWKSDDGNSRSTIEIKARRIQFLNKKSKLSEGNNSENEDFDFFVDEDENDNYLEDSFEKFLTKDESKLINDNN